MINYKRINKLMEIAVAMRPYKQNNRCFHVAFLLDKKRIISIGYNNTNKSHPKTKNYPYSDFARLHAEMSAILKVKKDDLSGTTLVVIRLDKHNQLKNSKPCRGCMALIKEVRIDDLIYSDDDKEFHYRNLK